VGVHAGPLDAMALLVGAGLLGVLPIGPGSSASAAMLLFGASGVGPAAAAGVLLTATGFTADLGYAAWGAGDMLWRRCPARARRRPRRRGRVRRHRHLCGRAHLSHPLRARPWSP